MYTMKDIEKCILSKQLNKREVFRKECVYAVSFN